jgi:hypothetical protein
MGALWLFDLNKDDFIKTSDILSEKAGSPFKQEVTKVFQPSLITNRISVQKGWLTVGRFSKRSGKIYRFDWNKRYKKQLTKFEIHSDYFQSIRYDLDMLGINRMSLFPDIDGVASYCEWLNTELSDESS